MTTFAFRTFASTVLTAVLITVAYAADRVSVELDPAVSDSKARQAFTDYQLEKRLRDHTMEQLQKGKVRESISAKITVTQFKFRAGKAFRGSDNIAANVVLEENGKELARFEATGHTSRAGLANPPARRASIIAKDVAEVILANAKKL